MGLQLNQQGSLPLGSPDAEQAIHTLNEWRVQQAAKLRHQLHQLREAMVAAGELVRDGAAPPSIHTDT